MHILNGQTESRAGKFVLPGRLSERSTMAGTLNDTPGSNRLHIGVFGKTNSGKSSFINAFTHQEVSIVADVAGTTTDPVYKPMEISPLGPCVIIDTAGFDDETELGERRVEKTKLAAEKADIAVIRGIWRGCLQRGCFRNERCKRKITTVVREKSGELTGSHRRIKVVSVSERKKYACFVPRRESRY